MEGDEWRSRAACLGASALFFQAKKEDRPMLRAICESCPVQYDCFQAALGVQTEVFQAGYYWVSGRRVEWEE
jgi:hypothetical protein